METEVRYHMERLLAEAAENRLAAIARGERDPGRRRGLRRTVGRMVVGLGRAIEGGSARPQERAGATQA